MSDSTAKHFNPKKTNNKNNDKINDDNNKKPFDKKKYRQKKYSHKLKVKEWELHRKQAAIRSLVKDLKNDKKFADPELINNFKKQGQKLTQGKKSAFESAAIQGLERRKERELKREEILKNKEEKEKALKRYREKKIKNNKILSQRTKKGQPVMKGRLEALLEKIQNSQT